MTFVAISFQADDHCEKFADVGRAAATNKDEKEKELMKDLIAASKENIV